MYCRSAQNHIDVAHEMKIAVSRDCEYSFIFDPNLLKTCIFGKVLFLWDVTRNIFPRGNRKAKRNKPV
jgi:hypothetical protein